MRSLFAKLSLVFLLILMTLGSAILWFTNKSSQNYILEFTQKLNRPIAMYMAENVEWVRDGALDTQALDSLLPHVMMINPTVEVYLLDETGALVANQRVADGREGGLELSDSVDMAPITEFLTGDINFPLLGSNPALQQDKSIFSVWPIYASNTIDKQAGTDNETLGYIYVVLGSEQHETLLASIQGNYSTRDMLITLVGVLLLTLCGGLAIFFMLTRRLHNLASNARRWRITSADHADSTDNDVVRAASVRAINTSHPAPNSLDDIQNNVDWLPQPSQAENILESSRVKGDEIDILNSTYERMASKLLEQYRELEKSDVSRREFIASVSHDLRTPLTSLQNYLETLTVKWDSLKEEDKQSFVVSAHRQGIRLKHLITQLFELSKLNSPDIQLNPETFSILELVYDCAQDFSLYSEKRNISIAVDAVHDDFTEYEVHADIELIQRVLENLLSNALRHTPENGTIQIELEAQTDFSLSICIKDSGCGLNEEQIDSFVRTGTIERGATKSLSEGTSSSGGSGFGLSIVQRILQLHGSTLQLAFNSHNIVGTSFYFILATSGSRKNKKKIAETHPVPDYAIG